MAAGIARHGRIEIAYEVEGPADAKPLLLVMGLGLTELFWPEGFRRELVDRGFRVARFDNRDVGASTHLTELGLPSPLVLLGRRWRGYDLSDMADDALAVLDALDWPSAHVAGVSLGGMIAQTMACRHPARIRSLTSISSTPSPRIGRPHPRALAALTLLPARDREEAARQMIRVFRIIGSPGYPRDEEWIREAARRSFDRAHDPDGVRRQLAAIMSATDRRPALRRLRKPLLVVHGDADPLVRLSGGEATAFSVVDSRLVVFPGMGHDLPAALQPAIAGEMARLAVSADERR
ncbi:alpha/beta fold hydrolase [Actinoplanes xinjiangensis]|uniref:Pimeloyl-ACP methyl ester carboxylesterase n=1 Tax=Actinoplanes xinjiangensis TaxID=512350 RepID=A0A316E9C5_9ACTN|nr:alpha/beta hydrolase [Actinoplanes xinjiangensis]PWK26972.1 pimeloyl-ACP methyl ester carboxylesterase [Actinoplanes xinjiangensis]GIF45332.1 alpha/beta hydrolase [Actinoplanes xinjiangensis]